MKDYYDLLEQQFAKERQHAFVARTADINKVAGYHYPAHKVECHIDSENRWIVYGDTPFSAPQAEAVREDCRKRYQSRYPQLTVLRPSENLKKKNKKGSK